MFFAHVVQMSKNSEANELVSQYKARLMACMHHTYVTRRLSGEHINMSFSPLLSVFSLHPAPYVCEIENVIRIFLWGFATSRVKLEHT